MKEDFLHYVWQYKLFASKKLITTKNEEILVLNTGTHNKNSGPDFLNAQLKIKNQLWVGNVEIHLKSSDWYAHFHEVDKNYDAVILHVVWEDDVTVFMKNNAPMPTLVIKDVVVKSALQNYKNLFSKQQRWIPCEKEITTVDAFIFTHWKERLFFERLERKSDEMKLVLEENKNDFEAVLFQLLVKNFGLKVNGEAFFRFAKSIDYAILRKVRFDENQLSALLFGQAGFLEEVIEDEYYLQLQNEYEYLKHKYNITPISKNVFSFFRMRPHNFPTIRIAQLVGLYHQHQNLFSKILEITSLQDFYVLFHVSVNPFWKTHFTFDKTSKSSTKKITQSFVDLLIINTIMPLKFLYYQRKSEIDAADFLGVIRNIKAEKNSIVSKFKNIGVKSENGYDTQALLELKNNYCTKKRCLYCAIGVQLLNK